MHFTASADWADKSNEYFNGHHRRESIFPFLYSCFIGLVGRVFVNGPGDLGLIPGHIIPKTLTMVLDTSLLNSQQYKVRIKSEVEQSRERSSTLPYTLV